MIKVKILLEEKLEVNGTYDPGSQVTLINSKLVKIKEKTEDVNKIFLKTVNGVTQTIGLVTIKVKIFEKEEYIDVFIVARDDFEDFLIGLDIIKKFKLIQDEKLQISQKKETQIGKKINTLDKNEEIGEDKVNFNEHVNEDEFRMNLGHLDRKKK